MVLEYHDDELDQAGLDTQTELNHHGDKLELIIVVTYLRWNLKEPNIIC
jgi:hypothetical protein